MGSPAALQKIMHEATDRMTTFLIPCIIRNGYAVVNDAPGSASLLDHKKRVAENLGRLEDMIVLCDRVGNWHGLIQ